MNGQATNNSSRGGTCYIIGSGNINQKPHLAANPNIKKYDAEVQQDYDTISRGVEITARENDLSNIKNSQIRNSPVIVNSFIGNSSTLHGSPAINSTQHSPDNKGLELLNLAKKIPIQLINQEKSQ